MTKKEIILISEVVTKAVLKSLSVYVRKIIREELEIRGTVIQEEEQVVKQPIRKTIKQRPKSSELFSDTFREIIEGSRSNIKFPSTGNNLLDEMIMTAPKEERLVEQVVRIPKGKPIPIEELYLNDIKKVTPAMAENLDYTEFFNKMDESKGSPPPMVNVGNTRALYTKDESSIVEHQKTGEVKVVKSYRA